MNKPTEQEAAKLRDELKFLEDNYLTQPPVIRAEDLEEINRLRGLLGMRMVDDQLIEIAGEKDRPAPPVSPAPKPEETSDQHAQARVIYQQYLQKQKELDRHREYADKVVKATSGHGMTPVLPLAKMGTKGGPLLCDYCEKPILLEGGKYHGKNADVAWREHPNPTNSWTSWILGGMVVELDTNHTLRIYHGYPNQGHSCCGKAGAADDKARREFSSDRWKENKKIVVAFVKEELLPKADEKEQRKLIDQILSTLFGYDPGFGINRPPG